MKKLIVLMFFTLISLAHAKITVETDSLADAEGFKVDKAVKEKSAERSFAGGKAKKESAPSQLIFKEDVSEDSDSEVRFWEYSE
jgi:hypothetical protein